MAEYIDREALPEKRELFFPDDDFNAGWNACLNAIAFTPAADVAPVIHAHRLDPLPEHRFTEENNTIIGRCSNCKSSLIDWTLYCPSCGAKMDEEN